MSRAKRVLGLIVSVWLVTTSGIAQSCDDDGLVACWTFDGGEGETTPGLPTGNLDALVVGPARIPGVSGDALEFDGVDDYVDLAGSNSLLDKVGDLTHGTISLWFRFDSAPAPGDVHMLFYLGDGRGGAEHSGLFAEVGHFQNNRRLYFTYYDRGSVYLCFETDHLEVGTWYHYAVVVTQTSNTGYLNGEELVGRHYNFGRVTDRLFFSDVATRSVFWVGRGSQAISSDSYYLHGAIDDLRIYDRPLNSRQIREYYTGIVGEPRPVFLRGDGNGDGDVNIADAAHALNWLFASGQTPECMAGTDTNGDATVNIADPTYLLNHLFAGGPAPVPPFPSCGVSELPGDETLGCETPTKSCE